MIKFLGQAFLKAKYFSQNFLAGISTVSSDSQQVGNNNFWIKGKRKFRSTRYWWEKDPTKIPEVIPLVDVLEELEEEEQELESYIWELEYEGIADKILTVLHAYAEILKEQAEMKRESLRIQAETECKKAIIKANRKAAITLLLS